MVQKISKTQSIKGRLKQEGKVSFLDQPHHIKAIAAVSEHMEAVRREFQIKEGRSQETAQHVILC